jgi:hypothetical protein
VTGTARRLAVVATTILMTTVGCSAAEPPTTSESGSATSSGAPASANDAQKAWAATVCGIDQALLDVSRAQDRTDPGWAKAPAVHRAEIVALLNDVDTTLKSLQQQVGTLTPSPFTGGEEVVEAYRTTIDPLQERIATSASEAAVLPPEGVAAAFRLAMVELVSFTVGAPGLEDPLYAQARRLAPACGGR